MLPPTNDKPEVYLLMKERTSSPDLGGGQEYVTDAAELAHAGGSGQRGAALPVLGARPVGADIAGGHGAAGAGGATGARRGSQRGALPPGQAAGCDSRRWRIC